MALDLPEERLAFALVERVAALDPPVPVLAWVADPELADRVAQCRGVTVIDARGAAELTVARAILDSLGVEQDRRVEALTHAVERLPEEFRRPLA